MVDVVFAVPYAADTTLRFVRAAAELPDVRLGIVSQDALERFPAELRERVAAFQRVQDALNPDQLAEGVRGVARQWGGSVDRLIGVLEQLQVPLAQVRERLKIRGMDVEEAHNFRDKARMKDRLRANDLPCAKHGLATDAKTALSVADSIGYPLVCKPPAGAGARNTFRVDDRAQLEGYLRTAPPNTAEPMLLEEFVVGQEHSFDSVSLHGKHVFHSISHYYPTPLEVVQTPWIQWCVLLPRKVDGPEYDDIRAAGTKALTTLGMVTGISHMEWFRRPDGSLAISEVAARPPGAQFTTLLSYAHDFDFYRGWAELLIFERFQAPERRFSAGAAFLRGQGSGRVVKIHGLEEAQRELGHLVVEARLPKEGEPQASSYEGQGFVILRDPSTEAVEQGLKRLISSIRIELG
jgi:biotin carboxylase